MYPSVGAGLAPERKERLFMSAKQTSLQRPPTVGQVRQELRRVRYQKKYWRVLKSTIYTLVVVAAAAVLMAAVWLPVLQIYGRSMAPTLNEGETVLAIKSSHFKTGDLMCFYLGNKILVRRCIAGPGQSVDMDEAGNVYVDGGLLEEPYLEEKALGETDIKLPYVVPEDRMFVMADRRAAAVDSRNTAVGCVAEEQVVGKIFFRVWPLADFGIVR